jgi:hypothetical protein
VAVSRQPNPWSYVQEGTGGTSGTRVDTTYAGFGTVRPRVQIPGSPRPFSYSRIRVSCRCPKRRTSVGSQFPEETVEILNKDPTAH